MATGGKPKSAKSTYLPCLLAGAMAGLFVDVALYPLDTLKTRLQSQKGFQKAGGFRRVYQGVLTVATGSMPISALFYLSYEITKTMVQPHVAKQYTPLVNMFAAGSSEALACMIRVPTEVVKQRKQTYVGTGKRSSVSILVEAYKAEGLRKGMYRGFLSTVARDLPYTLIELPLWEMLKTLIKDHNNGEVTTFQSALCGSIAGGIGAAVTTPLDLAKTRIMLAEEYTGTSNLRIKPILASIYFESGLRGLFAGVTPRMTSYLIGCFLFFGAYHDTKRLLEQYFDGR